MYRNDEMNIQEEDTTGRKRNEDIYSNVKIPMPVMSNQFSMNKIANDKTRPSIARVATALGGASDAHQCLSPENMFGTSNQSIHECDSTIFSQAKITAAAAADSGFRKNTL